ncbi:MAG: dockerin type I repeat-containing protein [Prevotella sp.]|nr:dockerin type I repeat-containing protein [Prevotella sp.]
MKRLHILLIIFATIAAGTTAKAADRTLDSQIEQLYAASATNPVDATWLIVNPSFETGDETGWTLINKDPENTEEFKVTNKYSMSSMDGQYLMNAFQWWASSIGVRQVVEDVPSGVYEISAVVCTWENRYVWFSANEHTVNTAGINDQTGIPVSIALTIDEQQTLDISAGSTGAWWEDGHNGEVTTFFKLDDVRLTCKGLFLNGMAKPLPNDNSTLLTAGQWYYYDAIYPTQYLLRGNIDDMVCSSDGMVLESQATTQAVEHKMTLAKGRIYFKTTRSDATLSIESERELLQDEFTAVALNVDGLPQKILLFISINEDGPGSDGTKLISQYLKEKGYDFIGVSEDFNYHGSLMSELGNYDSGTVRATLSIGDLSYPFDTDGLNLIWKRSKVTASNESWTRWNSMTSTDGNQYVKKGFRHYDMTVGEGMVIDVYVLHMDAGDDAVGSRENQWAQLATAINASDASRPKLIIGDTNSRWTREDIHTNFKDKFSNFTMSDVWVVLCRNNIYPTPAMADLTNDSDPTQFANYEVVDKIIYLNPKEQNTLLLTPQSFCIEQDYTYGYVEGNNNDKPLGDHKPVVVEFSCMKAGNVKHLLGDVNRDGHVDITDVTIVVSIILGNNNAESSTYDYVAADVNMDGKISIIDVTELIEIILKQ